MNHETNPQSVPVISPEALAHLGDGKIAYVNSSYGTFPGALHNGLPVGIPRLFAGHAG